MDDQNDKDVNVQDKLKKNNKSFELIFLWSKAGKSISSTLSKQKCFKCKKSYDWKTSNCLRTISLIVFSFSSLFFSEEPFGY